MVFLVCDERFNSQETMRERKKQLKLSYTNFYLILHRPIFVTMFHFTVLDYILKDVTTTKDSKSL